MAQHPGRIALNAFLRESEFDRTKFAVLWNSFANEVLAENSVTNKSGQISELHDLFESSTDEGRKIVRELIDRIFASEFESRYWPKICTVEINSSGFFKVNENPTFEVFNQFLENLGPAYDLIFGRPKERMPALMNRWLNDYSVFSLMFRFLLDTMTGGKRGFTSDEIIKRAIYGVIKRDPGVVRTWDDKNKYGR